MPTRPDLMQVIDMIKQELPGWWWRVGTCYLSDDAALGPDYNDPQHRERLLQEFPTEIFDGTIDIDRRPSGDLAAALLDALNEARELIANRPTPGDTMTDK